MKTFEGYLQDRHADQYNGLDDNMPDAYSDWLENLDIDDFIEFGEKFGWLRYEDGKNR